MIGGGSPMIAAAMWYLKGTTLRFSISEVASHWDATPLILNYLLSDPRTVEALENAGIITEEYTQFVKSLRKKN
jgi:hypothetical protein